MILMGLEPSLLHFQLLFSQFRYHQMRSSKKEVVPADGSAALDISAISDVAPVIGIN
jgi:hypothetical protein